MFIKDKDYSNYVHTKRIDLGEFFEKEEAEVYLTVRELTTKDVLLLKEVADKKENNAIFDTFRKILPGIIVDHNFYVDENTKMSVEEVSDLLFERIDVIAKVITEIQNSNFIR